MSNQIVNIASLSDQVEIVIREKILSGELAPGQRISIDELSLRWGVSSTPVRDAIRRLEKVGFLKIAPRRGIYVSEFDAHEFKEVFDLRIALECLAVESATGRIPATEIDSMILEYQKAQTAFLESGNRTMLEQCDPLVHEAIIRYCDNQRLKEIVHDLHDLLDWARRIISVRRPETYELAFPEHMTILNALKAQNMEEAQMALRRHLKNSYNRGYGVAS